MGLRFRAHSTAPVSHNQHHRRRRARQRRRFRQTILAVSRFDENPSTLVHRIARVQHQVEKNLLHLRGIDLHQPKITVQVSNQFELLAQQPREKTLRIRDDLVQAQNARLDHLLPRDSQQLLDQRSPLFARHADLFRMMQQAAARRQTRNEQVCVQGDPSEQIVKIMSHAAYQAPDDLHLLRFPKTLLRAFALGDVLGHADRELGLAIDAPDQRNRKTHPPRNTRLAQVAQFQFVRFPFSVHQLLE